MSPAHAPQVAEALAYLRGNQAGLLADVVRAERVLWVGSGVSRSQVLPLEDLLDKLIRFLQAEMDAADESDGHYAALQEIAETHFSEEFPRFLEDPVNWRPERAALKAAVSSYSDILATEVPGKDDDYLLWDGIDIREAYGAPEIAPGPEHDLIAILIRERVVDALVTTNWDGLIEEASRLASCADDQGALAVYMTNESFQTERGDAQLNKIHGCAVLARANPDVYRRYLVARITDIAVWRSATFYSFIISRIESLLQSRRSVFLGLSVQDYNLLALIANATTVQPWSWNKTNPSYVFAAKELGQRQKEFLNIAYRAEPATRRPEIRQSSSLSMYSGPVLASFVVETIRRKLEVGLARAADYNSVDDVVQSLSTGLEELEKALLARVGSKLDVLVRILKQGLSSLLHRYFDSTTAQVEDSYFPLFPATVPACSTAAEFKNLSLPELTVALCLVGLGRAHGIWEPFLVMNDPSLAGALVLRSKTTRRRVQLVITRDEVATSAFKATEVWREGSGSMVLLQTTGRRVAPTVRGLSRGIGSGRTVGSTRRQSWLTDLHPAVGAPSDMMAAFRAEVAL